MMHEKKRYNVTICGEQYTLISADDEQHVQESVHLVDQAMQEIAAKSTSSTNQHTVAVLAALRMASSMLKVTDGQAEKVMRHQKLIALLDEAFATVSDG